MAFTFGLALAVLGIGCSTRGGGGGTSPAPAGMSATAAAQPQGIALTVADPPEPTSEFRALFVAMAYNLDWPSEQGLHPSVQQDEIEAIVNRAKNLNCNVIILQVRAAGERIHEKDTLPQNKYEQEPWAAELNYGQPPGYDPLLAWCKACAREGIELHFWINPFRVNNLVKVKYNGSDVYLPVRFANGQLWLDARNQVVRQYVKDVVDGLLAKYGRRAHPQPFAAAAPGTEALRATGDDDGGGDGVIYDHYIPEEGWKLTAARAGATATATKPSPAQKRLKWLETKYNTKIPATEKLPPTTFDPATKTLEQITREFIEESATLVRGRGAMFGYSPMNGGNQAGWAKQWMGAGYLDYVVPELYFPRYQPGNTGQPDTPANPNRFKRDLEGWLSANPQSPTTSPIVVAGLATGAVQAPEKPEGQPWPEPWVESEIRGQMDDVRKAHGTNNQAAQGEAHYSGSALRLANEGGPRGNKNLGEKLKWPNGFYAKGSLHPDPGTGPKPGKPDVVDHPTKPGFVQWAPPAGDPLPKHWLVWTKSTTGPWNGPDVMHVNELSVSGITAVRVKAVNERNRRSDFGRWH
jgi:hypothetical protein